MAKFEIGGMENLIKRIDELGSAPAKVKKGLIHQGAMEVLSQMKNDAPGSGKSASHLAIIEGRSGDNYLFLDVGIGKPNWNECRGLWFQHYGFKSKAATLWMTSSFKRSKSKASKIIKEGLKRELNL